MTTNWIDIYSIYCSAELPIKPNVQSEWLLKVRQAKRKLTLRGTSIQRFLSSLFELKSKRKERNEPLHHEAAARLARGRLIREAQRPETRCTPDTAQGREKQAGEREGDNAEGIRCDFIHISSVVVQRAP